MTTRLSRRSLLRASGTTALAGLLAACAGGGDDGPPSLEDARAGDLTVVIPNFEVLTGTAQPVTMGVLDATNRPLLDADPVVTLLLDGVVVATGLRPTFFGEGLGDRGVYGLVPDLTEAGVYDVVVEVPDVGVGAGVFQARAPEDALVPGVPGQPFPAVPTPTTADPGPYQQLCTADPPCSMHERSLTDVLGERPVVLTIATPAFCQTAVCGPVVSVVEQLRDATDRDDVAWVHVEVFIDAGETLGPPVEQLALPTEPWTWVIGADGVVQTRFDGPVIPSLLGDAVRAL